MAQPDIIFPAAGATIETITSPRIVIVQGRVAMNAGAFPTGVSGHFVVQGQNVVKATGKLISWHRSGRNGDRFYWSLLFELGSSEDFPDGTYDLVVSVYKSSDTAIKTATTNDNLTRRHDGVIIHTTNVAPIIISPKSLADPVNGKQFMPYGSFNNDSPPTKIILTESTKDISFVSSNIFVSGSPTGFCYAAFSRLPDGTYDLDVLSKDGPTSATGLKIVTPAG